jgi:hypothetical protein
VVAIIIGKDADHFGLPLDLAIDAFERVWWSAAWPIKLGR